MLRTALTTSTRLVMRAGHASTPARRGNATFTAALGRNAASAAAPAASRHGLGSASLPPLLKAASVATTVALSYNPGPARADGGGFYPPPPSIPARQEGFIARVTGGGKRLALSAVVGFLAGKVFQKVTATVFYGVVGLMLITQYLAYKGTLNVRWGGVFSRVARFLDLDRDGTFGLGDLKKAGWSGASIIARFIPSAGGFVAGFAYGVLG